MVIYKIYNILIKYLHLKEYINLRKTRKYIKLFKNIYINLCKCNVNINNYICK